jgi:hypothetical protein
MLSECVYTLAHSPKHTHTMQCLLKEVDGVEAVEHAEGACYNHGEVGKQQHLHG